MKEFLESKGFKLETYPDGKFWVWISKDTHFMDDEHAIYQCTEQYTDFTTCIGGHVYEHSKEEFIKEVNKIIV